MMAATNTMRHRATALTLVTLVGALGIGGCATPPPPVAQPRTSVVLLPDEDGNVGAVTVTTDTGSRRIDQAYNVSTVVGIHVQPSEPTLLGSESVGGTYDKLLQAQPPKPKSFILRFVLDKSVLTEESKAMIPAVLAAIRERKPTEITIFGHADAIGPEKRNDKLSADRAKAIATLLRKTDPTLDKIDVQYFGDRAPLYPSESGKADPRNRRAEIMVL